jgi:DNA-binding protein HU-beta
MTKAELISAIAHTVSRSISKRTVEGIIDTLFEQLRKGLKRDKRFIYPGFGTFSVRKRAARNGRNPRTNEAIKIPAHQTIVFKPAKIFKASL